MIHFGSLHCQLSVVGLIFYMIWLSVPDGEWYKGSLIQRRTQRSPGLCHYHSSDLALEVCVSSLCLKRPREQKSLPARSPGYALLAGMESSCCLSSSHWNFMTLSPSLGLSEMSEAVSLLQRLAALKPLTSVASHTCLSQAGEGQRLCSAEFGLEESFWLYSSFLGQVMGKLSLWWYSLDFKIVGV